MSAEHELPKRGRPKTLDRDHVLKIAMMGYWADGPTQVAISEICRRSGASKPGIYREFGSDDGLKDATLDAYSRLVLAPLLDILASDQTFQQVIEALISFTVQDRRDIDLPDGCLFVEMRAHSDELGELTRAKVGLLRHQMMNSYKGLVERAKSNGQFSADIPTHIAALYLDAQNSCAMRLQKEGVANKTIEQIMRLAFAGLK